MLACRYIYFTANVARMVTFYRDVLGMTVLSPPASMDFDTAGWVQLRSGSFEVGIHRAGQPGCAGRNRNKLAFHVEDVAAARAALEAKGVKFGKTFSTPEVTLADFKDPDGNTLQLSSR